MKKSLFIITLALVGFTSCDKVENTHPVSEVPEGDWNLLYPSGDSVAYVTNEWPTFSENMNTNHNVLIEDFTGHDCIFCPAAANSAHQLGLDNPGRVVVSSIHAGVSGNLETNQELDIANGFVEDFTNPEGFLIGFTFGNDWPGSLVFGNPFGTVNRKDHGNGFPVTNPALWESTTNSILALNDLKVNIQAEKNYYPSTRGLFLHTEIEVINQTLTNELKVVVHLLEDSLVGPQSYPGSVTDPEYIHRDIFRGSIDGFTFGRTLDDDHLGVSGNYYFNYAYRLPDEYNADNMHVIIYVRDAVTEEVYQVIKKHL